MSRVKLLGGANHGLEFDYSGPPPIRAREMVGLDARGVKTRELIAQARLD